MNGALHADAFFQLLADARENQYVGIHRHTYGQHNPGNPGQSQRRAQHGHHCHQVDHVQPQRNHRKQAKYPVNHHHKQSNKDEAIDRGGHPKLDIFRSQAGTNGSFFGKVHWCGQPPGAQQQRQLGRLARTAQAGDAELVAQRRLNGRQTDNLFFLAECLHFDFLLNPVDHLPDHPRYRSLLDENHRHAAPDVGAGGPVHQVTTATIKSDVYLRRALIVKTGLGTGYLVTGNDDAALQRYRRPSFLAEIKHLGSGPGRVMHGLQPEFQTGGFTQNTLGFGSILHPRQLDHDAVGTLALHQGFGYPQLVDPVAHRGQVLLNGILANFTQPGWRHAQLQHRQTVALAQQLLVVGKILAQQVTCPVCLLAVIKTQLDAVLNGRQAAITDTLLAQQTLGFVVQYLEPGFDCLVHVHFQQKVHTT